PGFSGDSICWLPGLGEIGGLAVVGVFELDRWESPLTSSNRCWLNQSTQTRVAASTCSTVRQGPRRRISSVLNRPITDSASALPSASADRADRRRRRSRPRRGAPRPAGYEQPIAFPRKGIR